MSDSMQVVAMETKLAEPWTSLKGSLGKALGMIGTMIGAPQQRLGAPRATLDRI